MPNVVLSVVLVAGSQRERAQRVIDAIAAQTALPSIELILVDLAPPEAKRLEIPEQVEHVRLSRPDIRRWGIARAEGARAATGKSVAFIEDHCFPTPSWAEMLIEAHKNPWGGVGYAFTNANPDTYVTRTSLMARYGSFVHPAKGGRANLISGNNVSYKRDLLLSFGSQLEEVLTIDFNLQEILNKRDIPMFVESRALAAHTHFTTVTKEGITGHYYFAATRMAFEGWSRARAAGHIIAFPIALLMVLGRGCSEAVIAGRARTFLETLPLQLVGHTAWLYGELRAYYRGAVQVARAKNAVTPLEAE